MGESFHIHVQCSRSRRTPFEIDFSGAFFYFTVRQSSGPLTLQTLYLN